MARGEDLRISRFVGHRAQLFFEEAWGQRLDVPDADLGTGMTAEEVTELSARIDLDGLRAYGAQLEGRTRSIVEDLHPKDLDAVNDPA